MAHTICDRSTFSYQSLLSLHGMIATRFQELATDIMHRIEANEDLELRSNNIRLLFELCRKFVREHNGGVNAFLRASRRSLIIYLKQCTADKGQAAAEGIAANINKTHLFLDKCLRQVSEYMSQEKSDDMAFTPMLFEASSIRGSLERNRVMYVYAFVSMNFFPVLALDGQVPVLYVIKLVKFSIMFIALRVSSQWWNDAAAKDSERSSDIAYMVTRLLGLMLCVEALIVLFLFALDNVVNTSNNIMSLWVPAGVDAVLGGGVTAFVAYALANVMRKKRYFMIQERRDKSVRAFTTTMTYIMAINAAVPYFMMY